LLRRGASVTAAFEKQRWRKKNKTRCVSRERVGAFVLRKVAAVAWLCYGRLK